MRPIIGITAVVEDDKKTSLLSTYAEAVNNAGGIGVILPYTGKDEELSEYAQLCDGFLFSGGCDIDPCHFGEEILPQCGTIQKYRDEYELRLFEIVKKKKKPLLFICRGAQVLNVAMGGTLYQDIPSQYKTDIPHRQPQPKTEPSHEVNIVKGTPLHALTGVERMSANSFHHQAVKDVAEGLKVMATADDGIIEALYGTGEIYMRAYQWHPERLADKEKNNALIFTDFINAVKDTKK